MRCAVSLVRRLTEHFCDRPADHATPPLSDLNAWYYPSHGHDSDEEDSRIEVRAGNWGNKHAKEARWLRKGRIAPWGPGMEEWEVSQTIQIVLYTILMSCLLGTRTSQKTTEAYATSRTAAVTLATTTDHPPSLPLAISASSIALPTAADIPSQLRVLRHGQVGHSYLPLSPN